MTRSHSELADRYKIARTTIHRAIEREELTRKVKSDRALRRELKVMRLDEEGLRRELDKADAEGGEL